MQKNQNQLAIEHQKWLNTIENQLSNIEINEHQFQPQNIEEQNYPQNDNDIQSFNQQQEQYQEFDENPNTKKVILNDQQQQYNSNSFQQNNSEFNQQNEQLSPEKMRSIYKQKTKNKKNRKYKKSNKKQSNNQYNQMRLAQKSEQWVQKRRSMQNRNKFDDAHKCLEECTFNPKIHQFKNTTPIIPSNFEIDGIKDHLRRLNSAQKEKKRKKKAMELRSQCETYQWNKNVTIPTIPSVYKQGVGSNKRKLIYEQIRPQNLKKEEFPRRMSPSRRIQKLKQQKIQKFHEENVQKMKDVYLDPDIRKLDQKQTFNEAVEGLHSALLNLNLDFDD